MAKGSQESKRLVACDRCFKDKQLKEFIREHGVPGSCPWCRARKAVVVPLTLLTEPFEEVAAIYDECTESPGDTISFLMQQDWEIFDERISEATDDRMQEMTVAILTEGIHPKEAIHYPDYKGGFRSGEPRLEGDWHERIEEILSGESSTAIREFATPLEPRGVPLVVEMGSA